MTLSIDQLSTLEARRIALHDLLRPMQSVAVAFSAGADSTLMLKIALDVLGPESVVAVTGRSASLAGGELDAAIRIAGALGAQHAILDTDEFANTNYTSNPANRCYFCKTTLYTHLHHFIAARGLQTIINGVIADDLGDYRPGLKAADEHGIRAPLAEAGFTKADVRELSRQLGLPTHDKPASPCLSSRIPYGEEVTSLKLRMIEKAESYLRELGIRECRVRHHANDAARIEVPAEWIAKLSANDVAPGLDAHFRAIGYRSWSIDPKGFRSGSLNELIPLAIALPVRTPSASAGP